MSEFVAGFIIGGLFYWATEKLFPYTLHLAWVGGRLHWHLSRKDDK